MSIKEGEHLLDDEEITLSSSELDDVLSSAEFNEPDVDAEDSSLEQYGVWVKMKPEDLAAAEGEQEDFGLSDFSATEDSELTPEEEELLGKLEDEPLDEGEFEGLEADLEELGRGVESQGPVLEAGSGAEEEEISVDDLDVDLESLDLEEPSGEEADAFESLDDLDHLDSGVDSLSDLSAEQEIEVSLSENAAVEEHFTEVAAGPAARSSTDILEMIEADLKQIKSEIQTLKRELTSIGRGGPSGQMEVQPVPVGPPGFFHQEEDETIALTGDELDNILNTADITEATAEPMDEDLVEELPDIGEQGMDLGLAEEPTTLLEPSAPAGAVEEAFSEGEEILELGSLDLEEGESSEALDDIEIDIGSAEETSLEEGEIDLESLEEANEPVAIDLESVAPEEPTEPAVEEDLILEDFGEAAEDTEELLLEEGEGPEIEELTLGETDGEAGVEELQLDELEISGGEEFGEEPVDISIEEPVEGEEELGALGELEEGSTIPESAAAPEAEETLGEEILEIDELSGVGEEPSEELGEIEEIGGIEDIEPTDEPKEERPAGFPAGGGAEMPQELKEDVRSVLSYLDQLLAALPEEKIKEFVRSEYWGIYKKLFDELGLEA
jgi:pilus assembly protein FimV